MSHRLSRARLAAILAAVAASATPAFAQLDPLFFLKGQAATTSSPNMAPNVIFVVDTSNRMQRDAAAGTDLTDATTARDTSSYYDPFVYPKTGALFESQSLLIDGSNTNTSYRRKFENLSLYSSASADKGQTTHITAVGDQVAGPNGFTMFEAPTRLSVARAAMYQAVNENKNVARFGLIKTRQSSAALPTDAQVKTAVDTDTFNQTVSDAAPTKWKIHRPVVGANNGSLTSVTAPLVKPDTGTANADVLTILAKAPSAAGALIPAGNDTSTDFDTPVRFMLDDAWDEAKRLVAINSDPACRNTVVVLIVGGGEGTTAGLANSDLAVKAATFVNLNTSGRRVPIHVIALAPPASDHDALLAIATSSGGTYTEISKEQINIALSSPMQQATANVTAPAGTVIVPEVVNAINYAIQQTFATSTDFNADATATSPVQPYGKPSEYQVTSPIIATVNLNNAKSMITGVNLYDGTTFKQPPDVKDKQGTVIPQRNNVMVTAGVVMPSFDASLRAFLVYKPHKEDAQPTGYKFKADGTRIWVACTPGQTGCAAADSNLRNLYTADASGTLIPFTTSNTATLAPLMNLSPIDASKVIAKVRELGLGAVIDSTPAILNPPSLDPPPDDSYPGFAARHKDRRTVIWAGTNRGIFEAIDARTGVEVWGFIPLNLLPKLRTLLDGQPVGKFDYFMDGSPKLSDVKLAGICDADHPIDCWRTHMIVGQGPGGTFYQSFDVTMDNLSSCIAPDDDSLSTLLNCFNSTSLITLNWAFPRYSQFDVCAPLSAPCSPIATSGDLSSSATDIEKTVGQTWSDPAVGQVYSTAGPYSVLLGSGFLPYTTQQQTNRGTKVAGTTFYILDAKTGAVHSTSDVGSDGLNEENAVDTKSADDCTTASAGCKYIKNALQTDPVATGPSDSRFITKAYLGDLDGNVWRFDIDLSAGPPTIKTKNKLYSAGSNQPIFSSMATVNVGGTNQYVFFGTGSDLLPAVSDTNTKYNLIGVLDTGLATGTTSFTPIALTKANNLSTDERVTAFPAVAGDIVFFTTTTYKTSSVCSTPDAKLYALTFKGGAAYDTTNDGKLSTADSMVVKTIAGQRATAPFIVDQHLVFGTQGKVSMFGDPEDFNNGVGQAGVRILSWREVR